MASHEGFIVAGYRESEVSLVKWSAGGRASPLGRIAKSSASNRAAPALLELTPTEAALAFVDQMTLSVATFDPSDRVISPRARTVAEAGVDRRFSPALGSYRGHLWVAWTDGSATPMHVSVASVSALGVGRAYDVTPNRGGAAAPAFLAAQPGAPPALYFLDPRASLSVLHRVALGSDGVPRETTVVRPLSLTAEPAVLAPVGTRDHEWIAFTMVGSLATRAVGLVQPGNSNTPEILVPGIGYGEPLDITGISLGGSALFAAETCTERPATAPHAAELVRVDSAGQLQRARVASPAADPAIALGPGGTVAIAYRTPEGISIRGARCRVD